VADSLAGLPTDWPLRSASRFVKAGGMRWHVQVLGAEHAAAGTVLLLHGTGASTHSWRALAPLLARQRQVVMPDLPGHAYTSRPTQRQGLSLGGMAAGVGALLKAMHLAPEVVVGHSAGAAVAARACLDGPLAPHTLVSLNGAWLPPGGVGGWLYSPMARVLALNPVVPYFFSWQASRPAMLRRLLDSTGSAIDDDGQALYGRLVSNPNHVGSVLAMMAEWDLQPLVRDLPQLAPLLHLVIGERDDTVPAQVAVSVAQRLPRSAIHTLQGLGHLAHEEAPDTVAALLQRLTVPPG
jgi:magnesium chelatase accessory protein